MALIAVGYFVTDVLVRITEMPYEAPPVTNGAFQ
jgi:hypothetical protein